MSATSSSQDDRPQSQVQPSLIDEAQRLLAAAKAQQVPMRLIGGMGIRVLLGQRMDARFHRQIDDLDFVTTRRAGGAVERLLQEQGWEPERRFNALNGARRLLFNEREGSHKIDVFVQTFQMCHSLPLAERLTAREQTLPPAELAMSKLQVVSLNEKDRNDLYALLLALEVSEHDDEAIDAARIAQLTSSDWGLHHTFEINLKRLVEQVGHASLSQQDSQLIAQRVAALNDALQRAPKSRSWRMRAKIGERKRWYEEPEEVER